MAQKSKVKMFEGHNKVYIYIYICTNSKSQTVCYLDEDPQKEASQEAEKH